jgi:peptidyl-prolyl cis-trans isomerase A (cyclophilin A)
MPGRVTCKRRRRGTPADLAMVRVLTQSSVLSTQSCLIIRAMNTPRLAVLMTVTMLFAGAALAADTKSTSKTTKKTTTTKKATTKKAVAKKSAGPDLKKLLEPSKLTAKAPEVFNVRFDTSKGVFVIEVHREWSPNGADRFFNLVSNGYYDDVRFFRVIAGFMAQFGINGDPAVNRAWQRARIIDDPVKQSNKRGMVSFAMSGPDSRTTQLFINYNDENYRLDASGFSPFGKVVEGMEVVDALFAGYGEGAPRGGGPAQDRVQGEGNTYLNKDYPQLDFVKTARVAPIAKSVSK